MPTISRSLEFDKTPEEIWAVTSDMDRYGDWNLTHTDFPDGTPQLEQGASFREKVTIMGMPGEATWTVAELDAPHKVVLDGQGPMGVKLGSKLELAPNGDGTSVTMEASFDGGPLAGPMGEAVGKAAGKTADESLEKLKGLIG
jgi:carbon monoxide dehydrogenase subunit G